MMCRRAMVDGDGDGVGVSKKLFPFLLLLLLSGGGPSPSSAAASPQAGGANVPLLFPGESAFLPVNTSFNGQSEAANRLATIQDFAAFFNVDLPPSPPTFPLSTRQGGAPPIPRTELEQAVCKPELTSVALDLPREAGVYHFPYCVRVEQCGGCCILPHHSCQATATETVVVQAVKVNNNVVSVPRRRVRKSAPEYVTARVERHLSCECTCRLRPTDCDAAIHTYNENECYCDCQDRASEAACQAKTTHFWNTDSCQCLCRRVDACSTGQEFSHDTCSCVIPNFDYSLFG